MNLEMISGTSEPSVQEQIQQFRQGKTTLLKSDLLDLKNRVAAGSRESAGIEELLGSFDKIDANQDGISFQELADFVKTRMESAKPEFPSKSKADGLRSLSKQELADVKAQWQKEGTPVPPELDELINGFDSIDINKDGKMSVDEVRNYILVSMPAKSDRAQQAASFTKEDLTALKNTIETGTQKALSDVNKMLESFDSADENKDGKVDFAEYQKVAQTTISEASSNGHLMKRLMKSYSPAGRGNGSGMIHLRA